MKLHKILLSASLLLGSLCANAQEEVTEYVFNPNWYIQAQFGAQETLGEASFGKLLSPNAQIAVGYNFNPYIGARLVFNSWQSKGANNIFGEKHNWKWNYIAPTVDAVFNMTNILGGYNPERVVEVDIFGGIGANFGYKNGEAVKLDDAFYAANGRHMLHNLWRGGKVRFVGQFGADVNFNINKNWAVGLELQANVLNDGYNSKKAGNADWYFNGLVGVKYTFGDKYTKQTRVIEPAVPCEPTIVEKEVIKYVEVPAKVQPAPEKKNEVLRRDVFFKISNTVISKSEMVKVAEVADYLKSHPDAKVTVTGYADKGTGTRTINLRLSKQRAQAVYKALTTKYGISGSRIEVKSMGEEEFQPYSDPVQNRVAICIAE